MKNIKPQTWFSAGCLFGAAMMMFIAASAPPKYALISQVPWTNSSGIIKPVQSATNVSFSESGPIMIGYASNKLSISDGLTTSRFLIFDSLLRFNIGMGLNTMTNMDETVAQNNSSFGDTALAKVITGRDNSAFGENTMLENLVGSFNTGHGSSCLQNNTNGNHNTAIGISSLLQLRTGDRNTALGAFALDSLQRTNDVIGIGYQAGINAAGATNIFIGGSTEAINNNAAKTARTIVLGDHSLGESEDIVIGHTSGTFFNSIGRNISIGNNIEFGSSKTNEILLGHGAAGIADNEMRVASYVTKGYFFGDWSISGTNSATNGFASFSTITTNAVGGTGYTNNLNINQTAYLSGSAVAVTIKNRAGTTIVPATTFTGTLTVPLQPGWAVTAASGLTGTVTPF